MNLYSSGKLLITGEYLVLDGAEALALPLSCGQSLNYKDKEIKAIMPILIKELDLLTKKENNLSFENLLKLAMNYLDKESSNIAS